MVDLDALVAGLLTSLLAIAPRLMVVLCRCKAVVVSVLPRLMVPPLEVSVSTAVQLQLVRADRCLSAAAALLRLMEAPCVSQAAAA